MAKSRSEQREICTYYDAITRLLEIQLYMQLHNHPSKLVNPNFTKDEIDNCMKIYRLNLYLVSTEGQGKTNIVRSFAKSHGYYCHQVNAKSIPYNELPGMEVPINKSGFDVEYILKHMSINTDEKLPKDNTSGKMINKGTKERPELVYVPPVWITELKEKADEAAKDGKLVYLFLDEFTACDLDTKKIFLGIILDRVLRGFVIPDNVVIVAAGNYDDISPDAAMYNRFLVACLDRAKNEMLPVCQITKEESKQDLLNRFILQYDPQNTGKFGKIRSVFDVIEFDRVYIDPRYYEDCYRILKNVIEMATDYRNLKYDPSDVYSNSMDGGVSGLSMSHRSRGFILDFLMAADATKNFTSIILRFATDNLGFESINHVILWTEMMKIRTVRVNERIRVVDNVNILLDILEELNQGGNLTRLSNDDISDLVSNFNEFEKSYDGNDIIINDQKRFDVIRFSYDTIHSFICDTKSIEQTKSILEKTLDISKITKDQVNSIERMFNLFNEKLKYKTE